MNGLDFELEQLRQRLGELQAEQQGIQFRIQQLLLERQRMASPPVASPGKRQLRLFPAGEDSHIQAAFQGTRGCLSQTL